MQPAQRHQGNLAEAAFRQRHPQWREDTSARTGGGVNQGGRQLGAGLDSHTCPGRAAVGQWQIWDNTRLSTAGRSDSSRSDSLNIPARLLWPSCRRVETGLPRAGDSCRTRLAPRGRPRRAAHIRLAQEASRLISSPTTGSQRAGGGRGIDEARLQGGGWGGRFLTCLKEARGLSPVLGGQAASSPIFGCCRSCASGSLGCPGTSSTPS